jgi:hypothetical protein
MGFGDVDRERRNNKGVLVPKRTRRVIEFDEAVFLAMQELVDRLSQSSSLQVDSQIAKRQALDVFVQQAVQRELHRRGVTWWEARVSKAMRVMSGIHS